MDELPSSAVVDHLAYPMPAVHEHERHLATGRPDVRPPTTRRHGRAARLDRSPISTSHLPSIIVPASCLCLMSCVTLWGVTPSRSAASAVEMRPTSMKAFL